MRRVLAGAVAMAALLAGGLVLAGEPVDWSKVFEKRKGGDFDWSLVANRTVSQPVGPVDWWEVFGKKAPGAKPADKAASGPREEPEPGPEAIAPPKAAGRPAVPVQNLIEPGPDKPAAPARPAKGRTSSEAPQAPAVLPAPAAREAAPANRPAAAASREPAPISAPAPAPAPAMEPASGGFSKSGAAPAPAPAPAAAAPAVAAAQPATPPAPAQPAAEALPASAPAPLPSAQAAAHSTPPPAAAAAPQAKAAPAPGPALAAPPAPASAPSAAGPLAEPAREAAPALPVAAKAPAAPSSGAQVAAVERPKPAAVVREPRFRPEQVAHFLAVALHDKDELAAVHAGKKDAARPLLLTRWKGEARLRVAGRNTAAGEALVREAAAEIGAALEKAGGVGLRVAEPANLLVYVLPSGPGDAPGYVKNAYDGAQIVGSTMVVYADKTGKAAALQLLLRALGLPGLDYAGRESVLAADQPAGRLTALDAAALALLYSPELSPGMDLAAVRAAVEAMR